MVREARFAAAVADAYAAVEAAGSESSLDLLCALMREVPDLDRALSAEGVAEINLAVEERLEPRRRWGALRRGDNVHRVILAAADLAIGSGRDEIGAADVIRAIAAEPRSDAARALQRSGVDRARLRSIADRLRAIPG